MHLLLALSLALGPAMAAGWPDISVPPVKEGGGSKDAAVVIGISDYSALPDVPGAADNAWAWAEWLERTRGITAVKLLRDAQATDVNILAAVQQARNVVGPGGTLWFVFIGHGAPPDPNSRENTGDPVLVGFDAQATAQMIYGRSVPQSKLLEAMRASSPDTKAVVVLDACFSGASSTGTALAEGFQPGLVGGTWSGGAGGLVTVLTAAGGNEYAGPLPGAGRPAFSYLLLGSLRGWGDADGDRKVTASEAVSYTKTAMYRVVVGRNQTPEIKGPDLVMAVPKSPDNPPDLGALVSMVAPSQSPSPPPTGTASYGATADFGALADAARRRAEAEAQLRAVQKEEARIAAAQKEEARLKEEELRKVMEAQFAACVTGVKEAARKDQAIIAPVMAIRNAASKAAVEAYVARYGSASCTVSGQARAVSIPEVATAQAWLGSYRDTGDTGGDTAGNSGGASGGSDPAGLSWVSIPGGSFSMGSNSADASTDEKPAHTVTVTAFQMTRTEVTVSQYQACVDARACAAPITGKYCTWGVAGREQHPVNCIDWNQASAFARWAGGRLPSEAEWEYAAKADQNTTYAASDSLAEVAWYEENSGGATHPVGQKKANAWGLYDMSGNVWEWTQDWYHDTYSGAPANGRAWEGPVGTLRVIRGGSWFNTAGYARVANRNWSAPADRYNYLGFRIVR